MISKVVVAEVFDAISLLDKTLQTRYSEIKSQADELSAYPMPLKPIQRAVYSCFEKLGELEGFIDKIQQPMTELSELLQKSREAVPTELISANQKLIEIITAKIPKPFEKNSLQAIKNKHIDQFIGTALPDFIADLEEFEAELFMLTTHEELELPPIDKLTKKFNKLNLKLEKFSDQHDISHADATKEQSKKMNAFVDIANSLVRGIERIPADMLVDVHDNIKRLRAELNELGNTRADNLIKQANLLLIECAHQEIDFLNLKRRHGMSFDTPV